MAGFPMAKAKKYIGLHRKIGQLKAQLQKQKERFAAAEQELLKAFERTGVQNVAVDGAVVFLHRQIWASTAAGRAEELADAMHAIGMGDLVKPTVHSSRLSSYVRELPRDEDDMPVLPGTLKELVTVRDVFSVRVNERS